MNESISKQVKAIGYCRVAISTQTEQDKKIAAQKKQIHEAAKLSNIEIVEWFIQEGYEPMNFPYKALDKAHEFCEENMGIEYLLVASPDSISDSLEEFMYWKIAFERIDITIKPADEAKPTSTQDMFLDATYDLMVAQYEYDSRMEEIKEASRSKKAKKEI